MLIFSEQKEKNCRIKSLQDNKNVKNKLQTHEFNFTNGNLGVETGSKSVISINLNRVVQD